VIRHAFSKNLKVLAIAIWPDGAQLSRAILDRLGKEYNKEYGKDYVNLGYKSGGSVVLLGIGGGFSTYFPTDIDGRPLSELPLMSKVKDYSNIAIVLSFSAGFPGLKEYVLTVNSQFNTKVAGACTAVSAPEMYTFLNSGQLVGLMGGLKGAAEYEALIKLNGMARKGMDAQSVVHILIILFILFANVVYFIDKYRNKKSA